MKKTLIIVLDAFPFEKLKDNKIKQYLINNSISIKKLETIPGYSDGIYPSIWTGLKPAQTNFWSPFKLNETNKKTPNDNKDAFLKLLIPVLKRIPYKINPLVSFAFSILFEKILKKKFPFPPFYNFSIDQLFFYDNYQEYIMNPKKFDHNQSSIFSILRDKSIKFDYIFTNEFGTYYKNKFEKTKSNVIFYINSILDSYGHKYGPNSMEYNTKLLLLLDWINTIIKEEKFKLIIFSDHGMTNITFKFKPLPIFKRLHLKLNKDIIVWLDSTLVRIWLWNEKATKVKEKIISEFMNQKKGFFYNTALRKKYGLDFCNRQFGDLIFQVDPHYEVFPNNFHYLKFLPSKGMHGYIPTHKDSFGIFYSNQKNLENPTNILDIFEYLKRLIL